MPWKSIHCNSLMSLALGKKCFSSDPLDISLVHGVEKMFVLGVNEFSCTNEMSDEFWIDLVTSPNPPKSPILEHPFQTHLTTVKTETLVQHTFFADFFASPGP